jgi:hypothetical protein
MSAPGVRISKVSALVVLKPIVCLETAAAILGPSFGPEHVLRDIKRGPSDPQRIEWAWDISKARRRERETGTHIRVLAACVPTIQRAQHRSLEEVLNAVFGDLLPPAHELRRSVTIPAAVLSRRLACTHKQLLGLAHEGALTEVPHSRRRGRTGSPAITWESIVQFLTERRFQ